MGRPTSLEQKQSNEDGGSTVYSARRETEAAHILLLLDAPGIGPRRALDLIDRCGSATAAISQIRGSSKYPAAVQKFVIERSVELYIECLANTAKLGAKYVLWNEDVYPVNLREWRARPPVLFYKGSLDKLSERSLALVGSVDPSVAGLDSAARFARKCIQQGITVVSGLARGIDGASHREALNPPEGRTYAVVGHGLDFSYPADNRDLYESIPGHGAVISQFRTGVGPQKWTFPARNEVMCALALGTVIVEGKPGCGSIIQAEFSFKHRRPVFLLSKNLALPDPAWAHELVRRGAHVVEHFDQVLSVVDDALPRVSRLAAKPQQTELFRSPSTGADEMNMAVIFDLDGVVVDSRSATAHALADLASSALQRPVDPQEIQVKGSPTKALEALGVKNAYQLYRAEYDKAFARHSSKISVFDQVKEFAQYLRKQGYKVGAVTAQPSRRARVLLSNGLDELFDAVLTHSDTQGKKEVGIAKVLNRFDVEPHRAAFIGDQSNDLDAARKAGVKGVGVLWGFSSEEELRRWPHDVLLSEQHELLAQVPLLLRD